MSRREMFSSSSALVAFALMFVATVLPALDSHPVAVLVLVAVGLGFTMLTIDSGGHIMLMLSAGFLMACLGLSIEQLDLSGSVVWALVGVAGLGYAEAVRLAFVERRNGVVEAGVFRGSLIGFGIVLLGTLATAGALAGLSTTGANTNWLLVPLALVLAVVGLVVLAVVVSRSPGQFDKRRWKPGERLTAPPRATSDDPSLKSSIPPTPPAPPPPLSR